MDTQVSKLVTRYFVYQYTGDGGQYVSCVSHDEWHAKDGHVNFTMHSKNGVQYRNWYKKVY